MDPQDISDRSRGVALALGAVIGVFGGHRFYVGKIGTGLAMLCTLGGLGIWWLYDMVLIAAGSFRDAEGKRVWRWAEPGSLGPSGGTREQYEAVLSEVDALRAEVAEIAERMDFMERMLAQARESARLPERG